MSHPAPILTDAITLAGWTRAIKRSVLQEMLILTAQPNILSFALGLPAHEMFPSGKFAQACSEALAIDPRALQYGPPFQPLKRHVVKLMALRGVQCSEEQVFLTAGAQQAMNLLARLLLDPGGSILIEELTYNGFQQIVEPYHPRILTVSTCPETGMDVAAVEAILASGIRPALIYSVTDGHNPMGTSMSLEKRRRLVMVAREYHVPIIEDDAYGFLHYEDNLLPPLRAFDDEVVFYVGSFSKILAPALRVGWIIAPEPLIVKLSIVKEASDIDTSTFSQRAISAYLDAGHLPDHIDGLRAEYRFRRDAMDSSLRECFAGNARWIKPKSGLFMWVELTEPINTTEFMRLSVQQEQVAFIPGNAFSVQDVMLASNCMRLNFSNNPVNRIKDGIERLARVLDGARRV